MKVLLGALIACCAVLISALGSTATAQGAWIRPPSGDVGEFDGGRAG
jgi:hypothetical protein